MLINVNFEQNLHSSDISTVDFFCFYQGFLSQTLIDFEQGNVASWVCVGKKPNQS